MTDPGVVTLVGLDSCVRINKAQAGNRVHREGIVMPSRFGVSEVHRIMAIPRSLVSRRARPIHYFTRGAGASVQVRREFRAALPGTGGATY